MTRNPWWCKWHCSFPFSKTICTKWKYLLFQISLTIATVSLAVDVIIHNSECSLSGLEKLAFFDFSRGKSKLGNPFQMKIFQSNYYFPERSKFLHYLIFMDGIMTTLNSKVFFINICSRGMNISDLFKKIMQEKFLPIF